MRVQVWRLLIGGRSGLHHLVVAAEDHLAAWRLAVELLGPEGREAVLEELENTGHPPPPGAGLLCRLPTREGARNPRRVATPWTDAAAREQKRAAPGRSGRGRARR